MRASRRLSICLAALAAAAALGGISAQAARVQVGDLVLTADGGFQPQRLPRQSYAPIRFEGHADIRTTDGTMPPALQQARIELDHDGRLDPVGLAVCPPQRIETATPAQARSRCAAAIVGTGHAAAAIQLPGAPRVTVHSPLTLFNGPFVDGNPTVVAHAQSTYPTLETFVVVVPVERRSGTYGYRLEFEVPKIAGGYGSLTHLDAKIGRPFRSGGRERSFITARCSDYILQTRGFFSFSDGTVVSGSVFKTCRPLP